VGRDGVVASWHTSFFVSAAPSVGGVGRTRLHTSFFVSAAPSVTGVDIWPRRRPPWTHPSLSPRHRKDGGVGREALAPGHDRRSTGGAWVETASSPPGTRPLSPAPRRPVDGVVASRQTAFFVSADTVGRRRGSRGPGHRTRPSSPLHRRPAGVGARPASLPATSSCVATAPSSPAWRAGGCGSGRSTHLSAPSGGHPGRPRREFCA
jgi:hypothetical protein